MNGIKLISIQLEYHVSSSTLSTIIKNKDKIIEEYNKNPGELKNSKRIRDSSFPKLEEAVLFWYTQAVSSQNIIVDSSLILEQAQKYACFLNYKDFKASQGWLSAFQK